MPPPSASAAVSSALAVDEESSAGSMASAASTQRQAWSKRFPAGPSADSCAWQSKQNGRSLLVGNGPEEQQTHYDQDAGVDRSERVNLADTGYGGQTQLAVGGKHALRRRKWP